MAHETQGVQENVDGRVHLNVREEVGQPQGPQGQGPLSVFGKASPHVRFMPTALLWFRWDLATMCNKCNDVWKFHLFRPLFTQLHTSPVCCPQDEEGQWPASPHRNEVRGA